MQYFGFAALVVFGPFFLQWVFYSLRLERRLDQLEELGEMPGAPLAGWKYLVVLGREVSADGEIEDRFKALLDRAVELYNEGGYKAIVLLGGDHHGNGKSYAWSGKDYLLGHSGLMSDDIITPFDGWPIEDMWAFSCSQEFAAIAHLYELGAEVVALGESQRRIRYVGHAVARGVPVSFEFVPCHIESRLSHFVGLAVTLVDPNESHILRFVMRHAKRAIVTARDK